jgi:hypothetical protein
MERSHIADARLYALRPLFDEKKIMQAGRRMGKSTATIFSLAKMTLSPEDYEKFCKMYKEILKEEE